MIPKIVAIITIKLTFVVFTGQQIFAQTTNPKITKQHTIQIKKISIEGNTVFSDSELETIVAPLKGQEVTTEQIFEVRNRLTKYYIDRGYRNSGAFIAPQKIQNGNITIKIIEESLSNIQITGLNKLDEKYIKSRLPEIGKPLNNKKLIESLAKLKKDPLIKSISGEIDSDDIGKSILLLDIEEADHTTLELRFTNTYSPSIGSFGYNTKFTHQNLLVTGDRIFIDGSLTEGLWRTGIGYSFPFNKLDGRVTFEVNIAKNEVVLEEIEEFGIGADYLSFLLQITQPIVNNPTESLTLGFAIKHTDSETSLFNGELSFPFTPGLEDGQSKITSLIFSQEYLKNWGSNLFAARSEFNVGINAFDATITDMGIDGIYWLWRGNIQSLIPLDKKGNVVLGLRLAGQLTPDQLLALEQFTLGGYGSVRGVIRNLQIGDNGVIGTVELRFNLFRDKKIGTLTLAPFVDMGGTWNNQDGEGNTLIGTGLSLGYAIGDIIEARAEWGVPLTPVRLDAQDNVTFSIRLKIL